MTTISGSLQKQHKSYQTVQEIMDNLEEMYGGQVTLARRSTITSLINSKQKSCMLTLVGFFAETENKEVELDHNTQIETMFKSAYGLCQS